MGCSALPSPASSPSSVLSFGLVGSRLVFMDLADDCYFLLEPPHERQFLELLRKPARSRQIETNLRLALDLPEGAAVPMAANCPFPEQSLRDRSELFPRARLMEVLKLWLILLRTRSALRTRALEAIVADVVVADAPDGADMSCAAAEHAKRFAAARKAVPIAPNCLLDSLALLEWLGPTRAATSLVFAVKLDPFAAHCWVQAGNLLLNDRLDAIARFHPVRVVACSRATR